MPRTLLTPAIHSERKAVFLARRPQCFACRQLAGAIKTNLKACGLDSFQVYNALTFLEDYNHHPNHRATEIHHVAGRLADEGGWRGVCERANQFLRDNPLLGKTAGLLL